MLASLSRISRFLTLKLDTLEPHVSHIRTNLGRVDAPDRPNFARVQQLFHLLPRLDKRRRLAERDRLARFGIIALWPVHELRGRRCQRKVKVLTEGGAYVEVNVRDSEGGEGRFKALFHASVVFVPADHGQSNPLTTVMQEMPHVNLVVTKISSRGTPLSRTALPTACSFPYPYAVSRCRYPSLRHSRTMA